MPLPSVAEVKTGALSVEERTIARICDRIQRTCHTDRQGRSMTHASRASSALPRLLSQQQQPQHDASMSEETATTGMPRLAVRDEVEGPAVVRRELSAEEQRGAEERPASSARGGSPGAGASNKGNEGIVERSAPPALSPPCFKICYVAAALLLFAPAGRRTTGSLWCAVRPS